MNAPAPTTPTRRWARALLVASGAIAAVAFVVLAPWRQWLPGAEPTPPAGSLYPRIPRIDVHVHVHPGMARQAMAMLGKHHVHVALNASGGAPGMGLEESLQAAQHTHGQLRPYCNLPFGAVEAPGFAERAIALLEHCKAAGAVGLKVGKGLGLGVELADGSLLRPDDARLDPVFEAAARLGLPILIHVGDPQAFFEPPTPANERHEELRAHPSWSFHGLRPNGAPWPRWEELFEQYRARVRRHPDAVFVGAHFGNAPEEPERVAQMLDENPRYVIETGARIPEMGRHPPDRMRKLFIKYQDRILFGTDVQMGPWGLVLGSSGADPDRPERVRPFFFAHWRYFETSDRGFPHPTPIQGAWTIDGIGLAPPVLEKIYWRNAARIYNITVEQHD
jgi:predicted TIM-barrel fold metal-dependent hydrolase